MILPQETSLALHLFSLALHLFWDRGSTTYSYSYNIIHEILTIAVINW
jgi:hypothetical protein